MLKVLDFFCIFISINNNIIRMAKLYKKINWLSFIISIAIIVLLIFSYYLIEQLNNERPFLKIIYSLLLTVIPNFIAVLIGFVVIYVFSNYLLKVSPTDELRSLIVQDIHQFSNYGFDNEDNSNDSFHLVEKLKTAKKINLISLSACNLLNKYRKEIEGAIYNGCEIRVIILKENSTAANLIASNQVHEEITKDIIRTKERLQQIKKSLTENKQGKYKEKIIAKEIDWIPSCSILSVYNNKTSGSTKLKMYPLDIDTPLNEIQTHMIVDSRIQEGMFVYLNKQFDTIWDRAEKIQELTV